MSELRVYPQDDPSTFELTEDHAAITAALGALGARFERWSTGTALAADASQEDVIAAYQADVDRIMAESGFQSVDVIGLYPEHPKKTELRQQFLEEHIHDDFEIRFFIEGAGQFYLHVADKVFQVLCEQGDLISVPAGTPHWFDMGPNPAFKCIRFFTTPEGWVARYTGDAIASEFPRFE
jgi:1,2-dihydroxy-3-keto-5-methylthiopentene dioxygenase